jgi:hypothetical protein
VKVRTLAAVAASSAALVLGRVWLRFAPGMAVGWASARSGAGFASSSTTETLAAAVGAAGNLARATCLEQGIALCLLLAAARVPARLVIGVNRSGDVLGAHAWVECAGAIVLGGAEAPRYSALPSAGG